MCDLWKGTTRGPTRPGLLPTQVDAGLARLGEARHLKLYNAGSFFDIAAVPASDLPALAERARKFERLIVECHPSLVGPRVLRFRDLLGPTTLEVALGLETIHPDVLPKLNKRMTVEGFAKAARYIRSERIGVRAFVLLGLPFVSPDEAAHWARKSIAFAFESGAGVVTLIPTRPGNGALDRLATSGLFAPPSLATLEEVSAWGVAAAKGAGRLFADTWDLSSFATCGACLRARTLRLGRQNLKQTVAPKVDCGHCGDGPPGDAKS